MATHQEIAKTIRPRKAYFSDEEWKELLRDSLTTGMRAYTQSLKSGIVIDVISENHNPNEANLTIAVDILQSPVPVHYSPEEILAIDNYGTPIYSPTP